MTVGMATIHAANTMIADDKGSLVNRTKCAGEHFKNDIKYGLSKTALAVAGTGLGYAAYKNPAACVKVAGKAGQGVATLGKWIGKLNLSKYKFGKPLAKAANALEKFGAKVIEKSQKYGKVGVLAAVAGATLLGITHFCTKQAYNAGKIDQKYIDNAKIEKMTGSVVV